MWICSVKAAFNPSRNKRICSEIYARSIDYKVFYWQALSSGLQCLREALLLLGQVCSYLEKTELFIDFDQHDHSSE